MPLDNKTSTVLILLGREVSSAHVKLFMVFILLCANICRFCCINISVWLLVLFQTLLGALHNIHFTNFLKCKNSWILEHKNSYPKDFWRDFRPIFLSWFQNEWTWKKFFFWYWLIVVNITCGRFDRIVFRIFFLKGSWRDIFAWSQLRFMTMACQLPQSSDLAKTLKT